MVYTSIPLQSFSSLVPLEFLVFQHGLVQRSERLTAAPGRKTMGPWLKGPHMADQKSKKKKNQNKSKQNKTGQNK